MLHRQGPSWEAQCHADTHFLLGSLRALPLGPGAGEAATEHLATLCSLRFADPSPSGNAIPFPPPQPSPPTTPSDLAHLHPHPARASGTPSSTGSSGSLADFQVRLGMPGFFSQKSPWTVDLSLEHMLLASPSLQCALLGLACLMCDDLQPLRAMLSMANRGPCSLHGAAAGRPALQGPWRGWRHLRDLPLRKPWR